MSLIERRPLQILATIVLYFIAALLSFPFGGQHHLTSVAWPPSGVSLAALILFGPEVWPGVMLGALLTNWWLGMPVIVIFGISFGNTVAALLGWYLLDRIGFKRSLERQRDAVAFILLGALLTSFVGASFGSASLWLSHFIPPDGYLDAWSNWWLGSIIGVLVVCPFLLTTIDPLPSAFPRRRSLEVAAMMVLVLAASIYIFSQTEPTFTTPKPRSFFIFPVLMVVAIRLGQRWLTASLLMIAGIVTWTTSHGYGRFWTGDVDSSLIEAQIVLAVLAVSKLVLAATVAERIDERKKLELSNAQRQAILNSAIDGIITIDHLGRILEFNVAAEKTFGFPRSDVIGREMAALIIPERFRSAHRNGMANYLLTGEGPVLLHRIELPAIRSDGSEFPVELSIVPLNKEGPPEFTGFIEDISERKKADAEREFAELSQKVLADATAVLSQSIDYRTTLHHIAEACIPRIADLCIVQIVHEDGRVRTTEIATSNPQQESLLRETAVTYLSDLEIPSISASVIRSGRSVLIPDFSESIYRSYTSDADLVARVVKMGMHSLVGSPIRHHGKVIGALIGGTVSSSRRYGKYELSIFEELASRAGIAIENARLYSEAQEAVQTRDEFLSIASHELRTPLTSLSLQLQVFSRQLKKGAPAGPGLITVPVRSVEIATKCQAQGEKLRVLLDDLLDITRIRLGRLKLVKEPSDLSLIVRDAVDRFRLEAAQKGSSITVESVDSVVGTWDQMRIDQVITNLISNAVKYGGGQPITVAVKKDEMTGRAIFLIRDHGIGITPEMKDRVFERFERADVESRKIPGLGLGLYICRQIVEAHGGLIRVESEPGKGSTFVVELPLSGGENFGEAKAV